MTPLSLIKLAVVGMGAVGKSTIIARLATGMYIEKPMTVGFDVETWTITLSESHAVTISLFDFGGQEQFRCFQGALITGSRMAIIVFDCTSSRTLMGIREWLDLIKEVPNEMKLLVGNKIDAPNCISEDIIKETSDELGIDYIVVSAKTGLNFELLKQKLVERVACISS